MELNLTTRSSEETGRLGRRLAAVAAPGLVFLQGDLGSGKTCLVRGWVAGLGLGPGFTVSSPSFTLIQTYPTAWGPVHHIDLYRLRAPEDLAPLGLPEYVESGALCLVEWPGLLGLAFPALAPGLIIGLAHAGAHDPDCRVLTLTPAPGSAWERALSAWPEAAHA